MTKTVLLIQPNGMPGTPGYERLASFQDFFCRNGVSCFTIPSPANGFELLRIFMLIRKERIDSLFISMPPFRGWALFFIPRLNVILDIRDGWSIAMKSGYGGTVKKAHLKSQLARIIEAFAVRTARLTITCTPGLFSYLETLHPNAIALVTNGLSDKDIELAKRIRSTTDKPLPQPRRTFICAGKFSEYGKEQAKTVIDTIASRYGNRSCILHLVGADVKKNQWIRQYIRHKYFDIEVMMSARMSRKELYTAIACSDCGIVVLRDPSYEFGTKVFDYLALQTPILDAFPEDSPFSQDFRQYLDTSTSSGTAYYHSRQAQIQEHRPLILDSLVRHC